MTPEFVDGIDHSHPWFTHNGLATRCRYVWNYGDFVENKHVDNHWACVKTDYFSRDPEYLAPFRESVAPHFPITALFSVNSDAPMHHASMEKIPHFATNAVVRHPNVHGLMLSIGNYPYGHGDVGAVERVLEIPIEKQRMFYAQYAVQNNIRERGKALECTGIALDEYRPFEKHLEEMRKSYFVISPEGAGIDCHRTWEALIVGAIPIVTRSVTAEDHSDWPIIRLEDWSGFNASNFTKQRYDDLWGDFKSEALHMDNYLNRLRERFGLR